MKNILFIYAEIVVEENGGHYHHNFLQSIINRYKQFGNLTICVSRKLVAKPTMSKLDVSGVKLRFIEKENTFKKRFLSTKDNKCRLEKEIKSADKIIAHFPSSVSDYAVKMAHNAHKEILGVVVGCVWDAFFNYNFKGKLLAPLAFYQMKKAIRNCDGVIYVSNKFLQGRYPSKNPSIGCSDVEITIHSETEASEIVKQRSKRFLNGINRIIVSTVGALIPYKNHEVVIKAMGLLKGKLDIQYEIIGGGDNTALLKLSEKLGVRDRVSFIGQKPHGDIVRLLGHTDIYIQPSKLEGMPRALIEAMSEGCPAIGSNVGGIPELLENEEMFNPGDYKELARLLSLLTPEDLLEMSKRNIKKAADFNPIILDQRRFDFINSFILR